MSEEKNNPGEPSVFSFMDYRIFLQKWFAWKKSVNTRFSHRLFANLAGFNTTSFIKMVMDGKRNMTTTSSMQAAQAMALGKKEKAFFRALVSYNQAVDADEKDLFFEELCALRNMTTMTQLEKDQYLYLKDRHLCAIREMTAIPGFIEDPEWIASCFKPKISATAVTNAIEVLLRLGLVKRNRAGKLVHSDDSLMTPAEISAENVYFYHREMLNAARQALVNVPSQDRDITAVTIPISRRMLKHIKQRIETMRRDIIDYVNRCEPDFEDVFQINIQVFPLTFVEKK